MLRAKNIDAMPAMTKIQLNRKEAWWLAELKVGMPVDSGLASIGVGSVYTSGMRSRT